MTPEEALNLLDHATAQMATTRENHARIVQAVTVLHRLRKAEEGKESEPANKT